MRQPRDYRPQQLYAITQRGNQSQWVYRDSEDFAKALSLMRRYSAMHDVAIHGYCLLHNHGHWILEASTPDSISNMMRDLQGRYSVYLNRKYRAKPWLLLAPLDGLCDPTQFSPYRRTGPVNWSPRYDAQFLNQRGFKAYLRYVELNSVRAGLTMRAMDWPWSSAKAHCDGDRQDHLLAFYQWEQIFRRPETIAVDWFMYLNEHINADRANQAWLRVHSSGSRHNRPLAWSGPLVLTGLPPPGQ